jgi:eukaryotic-like serine/threonine-protein kinase
VTGQTATVLGGRYRLGEPIGRGGMGTVWRAVDTVLGRQVAVKVLVLQINDGPDTRARFRREARVLARLSHPRLGGVYDYGEDYGRAFTVMEYITGETLQGQLARAGRIPATDAAEIAAQVAEGLHAAHLAGVIHRDVKPGNIILGVQGVKVVDFGIALGAEDDRLTATGTLIGSATYVAPERGTGGPATPASDVYSLGVVLYQMLAGTPPFTSTDPVQLVAAHSHDPVPPLPADVPEELASCCLRALAKEPARRPPSALAFASMLRKAGSQGPHGFVTRVGQVADTGRTGTTTQTLPQTGYRRPGPRRRGRWWLPLTAGLTAVAAVAGITVIALIMTSGPGGAARPGGARSPGTAGLATTWTVALGAPNPGQARPVLAPAGTTVRLTAIVSNRADQPVRNVGLDLGAPRGWIVTPRQPPAIQSIPAGGATSVSWHIGVPATVRPGRFGLVVTAGCASSNPCAPAKIEGSAIVPFASFSQAFDNAGIASHADTGLANLDGTGLSYQSEALATSGYRPGAQVQHDGISFTWPDRQPGAADNIAAQGQTFLISGSGAHLAFLGAADFGSAGGDGTIYYRDGSRQPFRLVMNDWWADQATAGTDEIAVTTPQPNAAPGQPPRTGPSVAVYFATIALQAGKTVAAVTLPDGSAPAQGVACLHLFAVAIS